MNPAQSGSTVATLSPLSPPAVVRLSDSRSSDERNPELHDEFPICPSDNDGFPHIEVESLPARSLQLETRGTTSQIHQGTLWRSGEVFASSVAAKLREFGRLDLAEPLEKCHSESVNLRCAGCQRVNTVWNRCDLFFCARCQPRLARERAESVEWWTKQIRQPKHVVLTLANTPDLTKEHVQHMKDSFTRLRRSVFAKNWLGGFYRLEVTNEGKGWHLHLHALVDCRFIDASGLAVAWNRCNRGTGHIVKVKDCREASYLKEVTKYAVKGSELARWSAADIATFVDAFEDIRTFGVFGELYGKRTEWKEFIAGLVEQRATCACGCSSFKVCTDSELEWLELHVNSPVDRLKVFAKTERQLELGVVVRDSWNLIGG